MNEAAVKKNFDYYWNDPVWIEEQATKQSQYITEMLGTALSGGKEIRKEVLDSAFARKDILLERLKQLR